MISKGLNAMSAFDFFLLLLAPFLSASHSNALTSLCSVELGLKFGSII